MVQYLADHDPLKAAWIAKLSMIFSTSKAVYEAENDYCIEISIEDFIADYKVLFCLRNQHYSDVNELYEFLVKDCYSKFYEIFSSVERNISVLIDMTSNINIVGNYLSLISPKVKIINIASEESNYLNIKRNIDINCLNNSFVYNFSKNSLLLGINDYNLEIGQKNITKCLKFFEFLQLSKNQVDFINPDGIIMNTDTFLNIFGKKNFFHFSFKNIRYVFLLHEGNCDDNKLRNVLNKLNFTTYREYNFTWAKNNLLSE